MSLHMQVLAGLAMHKGSFGNLLPDDAKTKPKKGTRKTSDDAPPEWSAEALLLWLKANVVNERRNWTADFVFDLVRDSPDSDSSWVPPLPWVLAFGDDPRFQVEAEPQGQRVAGGRGDEVVQADDDASGDL